MNMIRETRVLIDPEDVVEVLLTCLECQSGVSCRVERGRKMPTTCPHCGADWQDAENERALLKTLRHMQSSPNSETLRIQLQVREYPSD